MDRPAGGPCFCVAYVSEIIGALDSYRLGFYFFGFWQQCIGFQRLAHHSDRFGHGNAGQTCVIVITVSLFQFTIEHNHPMEKVECHLEELGTWFFVFATLQ
jgi:hypothetical protein